MDSEDLINKLHEQDIDVIDNDNVAFDVLAQHGNYLSLFSPRIRNDEDLVKVAVNSHPESLKNASLRLRSSIPFGIELLKFCNELDFRKHLEPNVKNDVDFAKHQLFKHANSYYLLNDELQDNEDLALIAIAKNPDNLKFCSDRIKGLSKVVRSATNFNPNVFQYASETLRSDPDLLFDLIGYQQDINKKKLIVQVASEQALKSKRFARQILRYKDDKPLIKYFDNSVRRSPEIISVLLKTANKDGEFISIGGVAEDVLLNDDIVFKFFTKETMNTFQFLNFNHFVKGHPEIIFKLLTNLSNYPKKTIGILLTLDINKNEQKCSHEKNKQISDWYKFNHKLFEWLFSSLPDTIIKSNLQFTNYYLKTIHEKEIHKRNTLSITSVSKKNIKRKISPFQIK